MSAAKDAVLDPLFDPSVVEILLNAEQFRTGPGPGLADSARLQRVCSSIATATPLPSSVPATNAVALAAAGPFTDSVDPVAHGHDDREHE